MNAKQVILTRQLPKTGQVISYVTNDDGMIEAGWWKGRLNANNKTRFITKTVEGHDVVIDRATGLMWAADGNSYGCGDGSAMNWNEAMQWAYIMLFAGFSDWRLPNINELLSIIDYNQGNPAINETFFPNTMSLNYWTSTTLAIDTLKAWGVRFTIGSSACVLKQASAYLRSVRGSV